MVRLLFGDTLNASINSANTVPQGAQAVPQTITQPNPILETVIAVGKGTVYFVWLGVASLSRPSAWWQHHFAPSIMVGGYYPRGSGCRVVLCASSCGLGLTYLSFHFWHRRKGKGHQA